ncbi:MAG: helix-hairpin-helix domain-containing protein [Gammaproteobacteria bacterium]|nr:helix-hairpin-helix domain-containing protein [Gammaproteobacteria bacterium]
MSIRKVVLFAILFFLFMPVHADPVNINTAGAEALSSSLLGVGDSKARAIIAYREQHGPFRAVNQLLNVKGIGVRTLDKNRANITIGDSVQKRILANSGEPKNSLK